MSKYDYSIKVTYQHGGTRTMNGTVSCENFRRAYELVNDDEGMAWPEKRATREILYIIKVSE